MICGGFFIPEDADDPPAGAVVEELDAVDASGEGLFVGSSAGFVAAEDLGYVAEFLDAIRDGTLVERVRFEVAAAATRVSFNIEQTDRDAIFLRGRGEARFGNEDGGTTVPVVISGRARAYLAHPAHARYYPHQ